ncbi:myotubularin-related protein 7-like [Mugil cephalus]|uniref:myotubularin-related protein 7-like n=1 Tax=Mugil cephalus TaxID=48193 RepID=UPI001FB5A616|nr:myotubularin-related protein 7-like [Mugil cephalus]
MLCVCVSRLHERTHSVWPQLWKDRRQFSNPLYQAELSQSQGVLRPNTSPYCFKMWKGLYDHGDKATPPRQSPADFLSAVREESLQLEEELTNHQERIAALTGRPVTWPKVEVPRRRRRRTSRTGTSGPDPQPITSPVQVPDDPSTCSDLESGVADLSSHSSSGGDPDLE